MVLAYWNFSLNYMSGILVGATAYYLWHKKRRNRNKYYFLREDNKFCQMCLSNRKIHLCKNKLCSYDVILKIVSTINSSKVRIVLCNPFLEIEEIGIALLEAFRRGVSVRIINSAMDAPHRTTMACVAGGIATKSLDVASVMMHNKFMVVDQAVLCRGSINLTYKSFTGNYENVQIIYCQKQSEWYQNVFEQMWDDNFPWHPSPALVEKLKL